MHPQDLILCNAHGSENIEYDLWKPEYGIDNFVKTEFTCGGCYYLAYAIYKLTGWSIYSIEDKHYYVVNNNGKAVDIYGVRPTEKAPTKYDLDNDQNEKIIPSNVKNIEDVSSHDYFFWAQTLVKYFPGHFGI